MSNLPRTYLEEKTFSRHFRTLFWTFFHRRRADLRGVCVCVCVCVCGCNSGLTLRLTRHSCHCLYSSTRNGGHSAARVHFLYGVVISGGARVVRRAPSPTLGSAFTHSTLPISLRSEAPPSSATGAQWRGAIPRGGAT